MKLDVGRIDWMPRKKVWRVILYKGRQDIPFGDFSTKEEAINKLRSLMARRNPTEAQLRKWAKMPDIFNISDECRRKMWKKGMVV